MKKILLIACSIFSLNTHTMNMTNSTGLECPSHSNFGEIMALFTMPTIVAISFARLYFKQHTIIKELEKQKAKNIAENYELKNIVNNQEGQYNNLCQEYRNIYQEYQDLYIRNKNQNETIHNLYEYIRKPLTNTPKPVIDQTHQASQKKFKKTRFQNSSSNQYDDSLDSTDAPSTITTPTNHTATTEHQTPKEHYTIEIE